MQKKKSGVKKCLEIMTIRGGGGRLMEKTILNFHFDYLTPSLTTSANNFSVYSRVQFGSRGLDSSGGPMEQ